MPKFHKDDFFRIRDQEEEELSEMDMDINGIFENDSDKENQEEAYRCDLKERQNKLKCKWKKIWLMSYVCIKKNWTKQKKRR